VSVGAAARRFRHRRNERRWSAEKIGVDKEKGTVDNSQDAEQKDGEVVMLPDWGGLTG
jgi:hypothetical protein